MRPWRKRLVWAGALVVGVYLVYLLLAMDARHPQDGHLLFKRTDIPGERNGFALIVQAARKVNWPEDEDESPGRPGVSGGQGTASEPGPTMAKSKADQLDDTLRGTAWDGSLAAEVVKLNSEAFMLWDLGKACARFQSPAVETCGDLLAWDPERWVTLAKVVCLRAQLLAHQGKQQEALDEAMDVVLFGHRAEGARGGVTVYFAGATVKHNALLTLSDVATRGGIAKQTLERIGRRLSDCRSDLEGLADAFRVEYTCYARLLDDVHRGKVNLSRVDASGKRSASEVYMERDVDDILRPVVDGQGRVRSRYLFQLNRTKGAIAQRFDDFIAQIPRHYCDMSPTVVPPGAVRASPVWPIPNAAGQRLCCQLTAASIYREVLEMKCKVNVDVDKARTMLALACYGMDKGARPASLQDLVPEYLEAVPVDDVSGQRMTLPQDSGSRTQPVREGR